MDQRQFSLILTHRASTYSHHDPVSALVTSASPCILELGEYLMKRTIACLPVVIPVVLSACGGSEFGLFGSNGLDGGAGGTGGGSAGSANSGGGNVIASGSGGGNPGAGGSVVVDASTDAAP